jgi:chromosome segregation ATPase
VVVAVPSVLHPSACGNFKSLSTKDGPVKTCLALLLSLCFFASPVLADNSTKSQTTKPVSTSKETAKKTDDQVLALIGEITSEVDRADQRLEVVETRLNDLDGRVTNLEGRQEATLVELKGLKHNQEQQMVQAAQLQSELAAAHQRADGLMQQASQLAAEANSAKSQAAQANQMAAQANAQAQQAWAHAQAADNAARPKGPGKLLAALFPRMLGHR